MRCLLRDNDKWQTVHPGNLSSWLWQHDGAEAVCIDGDIFYCGTETLAQQYRDRVDDHEHSYDEHQSMAEIIIEKQRAGERNQSVKVVWLGEYQRFENIYSGGLPE